MYVDIWGRREGGTEAGDIQRYVGVSVRRESAREANRQGGRQASRHGGREGWTDGGMELLMEEQSGVGR